MTKKILDSTVAEEEEDDEADPNGHSHKTNNFKMESMMKPFMGFSKMFSRRNSAPRREELRRVKIDFSQNGAKLPEGSIETISAGGGKSPGHHEGGGLTVKVKEDEVQQRRIRIKQKPEPRKTLNFFFTWWFCQHFATIIADSNPTPIAWPLSLRLTSLYVWKEARLHQHLNVKTTAEKKK